MSEKKGFTWLLCEAKQIYADRMSELRSVASERDQLKAELATLRESEDAAQHAAKRAVDELAKLRAEREPIDNGDGTVTALLPVTHPAWLDVECVRLPKCGETFLNAGGFVVELVASEQFESTQPRLILRPAPQPPEPVTWTAPLADGVWFAQELTFSTDAGRITFTWSCTGEKIRGITKPAKLGKYQFRDGVGTLVEESK